MSKFGKLDKKQVALALGLASFLGGRASAMNSNKNQVKSSQSLGAVGGATSKNNSNLLASSKMLKKSKSMSNLTKVLIGVGSVLGVGLTYEVLGDTLIDKAPTILKLIKGDNMKPEEKRALATKILDVINTFDIQKIGELKLPKYKGSELEGKEKEDYDKKYNEACDQAIKKCMDVNRVVVQRYERDGVGGGVTPVFDKYRALCVLCNEKTSLKTLDDLKSWDFKNKYDKNDVKEITFAKNRVRIYYSCDDITSFELQEDGKLKVISNNVGKKLMTKFTLEKPKK